MMATPRLALGPIYGSATGDPAAAALGRMVGARDAVLGAGAAIAVAERRGGANWVSMLALTDGIDAVVNLASPRLGWRGRALGIVAAVSSVAHLELARRLAQESG
jgi:hypothetical protein